MRKHLFRDYILPLMMVACCAFLWTETNAIPPPRFEPLGAAFFPRFILTVIMGLSVLLVALNLWNSGKIGAKVSDQGESIGWKGVMRMVGTLAMLVTYVALIMYTDLPYLGLTFVYLFLFGWFLASWNKRLVLPLLLSAAVVTGLIYGIFGMFLEVFFP